MQILNVQDVLDQQLKLLNSPGPSLSSFYSFDHQLTLFIQPNESIKQQILHSYKLANLKTISMHANNIFNVITYVLLNDSILQQQEFKELLQKLKCTVYSENIDLTSIIGFPSLGHQLSNKSMKKILVQFFQITKYYQGNIQALLAKYQIVLNIFNLFYRVMLCQFHVKDAKFYYKQLNKIQVLSAIFDYFDILYQIHNNLIVFQHKNICILIEPKSNQIFIGQRVNDISTKTSDFDFQCNQFVNQLGYDEHQNFNKQSLFTAPTPCFKQVSWDQVQTTKIINNQGPIKQVDQEMNESNSLKKLHQNQKLPQKTIHFDSEVAKDTQNFRVMLDSYTPNSPKQTKIKANVGKGSLKNLQKVQLLKNKNPQKLNASQIHDYSEQQILQRKLTLSQKAAKKQKNIQDDCLSMRISPHQLQSKSIKQNKLQSHVIQLKIQSSFNKRYKTSGFEQVRPKKMQIKSNLNISMKNPTKNYGKIPSFLIQKQPNQINKSAINPKDHNSPLSLSPLHNSTFSTVRKQYKDNKPKVNFTYNSNYKNNINLPIHESSPIQMRPTSGSSVTAVNYYDHEYIHPMSSPVTYRNSIIRANILPGYESYRYHY